MENSANQLFRVSEIEIHYRNKVHPKDRLQINSSKQAYEGFLSIWDMNKIELIEQFGIMLLDRQCRCIGASVISTGGTSACIVEPKLIFATALKAQASSIILAHNHPSGCLKPSDMDTQITENLTEGAKLLGMYVTDHLIISKYDYYSFTDNGMTSKSVKWSTLTS